MSCYDGCSQRSKPSGELGRLSHALSPVCEQCVADPGRLRLPAKTCAIDELGMLVCPEIMRAFPNGSSIDKNVRVSYRAINSSSFGVVPRRLADGIFAPCRIASGI